jgi:hypothetical protein
MALVYSPSIVRDGLILALDAADVNSYIGSGTAWNDISGNGNNGTITNSPAFSTDNGGILLFPNTANQSATISDTSILKPTSVTLCAWVYLTQYNPLNNFDGQFPSIIWKANTDNSGPQGSYGLSLAAGQFPRFTITPTTLVSTTVFPIGVWVHLVGTYAVGGTQILYRNGAVDRSTTGPASITYSTQPVAVATRVFSGTYQYPWNGKISNVHIYNRALTAQEVQQNYNATKTRFGL